MARMQKIYNADLRRFAKASAKRKPRKIKISFLIVCEGEKTEPNYFNKFKYESGNIIFKTDCEGKGYNTLTVVEEAIKNAEKLSQQYDNLNYADHNPGTQVYELVKQLIGQDDKLNEEIKQEFG